jgi:hypothetical protein
MNKGECEKYGMADEVTGKIGEFTIHHPVNPLIQQILVQKTYSSINPLIHSSIYSFIVYPINRYNTPVCALRKKKKIRS